ncbi:hypothetical protein [Paenibacillus sp. BC26]|uniref:hypothetical protein n=1 Tax=Paenibacillus sp. BC26 TaxID=1881032 RepID=UPI0008E43278|nr:hypothetical protein [Paenibacillus sp. BC26]SFT08590.1 hypothetical protein SAMN05428962_4269 [Paenibacillus sp. BC26]
MKLRFPLYVASTCLLSIFADKYILQWVGIADVKSIIFGLIVGVAFLIIEKSGLAVKRISVTLGIAMIVMGFAVSILANHYLM